MSTRTILPDLLAPKIRGGITKRFMLGENCTEERVSLIRHMAAAWGGVTPKFRLRVIERPSSSIALVIDVANAFNCSIHQGERERRFQGWSNGRVNCLFQTPAFFVDSLTRSFSISRAAKLYRLVRVEDPCSLENSDPNIVIG